MPVENIGKQKTKLHNKKDLSEEEKRPNVVAGDLSNGDKMNFHHAKLQKNVHKIQNLMGRTRPAVSDGHVISCARISTSFEHAKSLSELENIRTVSVPASRVAKAKFLKKWAREQRRKVLAGGMAATLVLPMLGAEAMAQSGTMTSIENLSGVVSAQVQADGTLLIIMENGAQLIVPENEYQLGEDGMLLISDAVVATALEANAAPEDQVVAAGFGDSGGLLAAAGGVVVAGLAVAAGSGSSSASAPGAPGTPSVTGFVIDGYISGATVFYDLNGNGELDEGEFFTTTDASGSFNLPGGVDAPVVAFGGVDISTGLQSTLTLSAPAGSTVVSPLTTMVQQLVSESGLSIEGATAAVLNALGLDASTDLLNEDPIADGNDALFAAGVKVAQFLTLAEAAGVPQAAAAAALAEALNEAGPGSNLLSDAHALGAVLNTANEAAGADAVELGGLASTIANANGVIDTTVSAGGDVQGNIAAVQQAVQGTIASEIRNSDGPPEEYSTDEIGTIVDNVPDVGEDGTVIINLGSTFTEDFSKELDLSDTQTEGAWYTDRSKPFGFEIDDEKFEGESVLKQTIDSYVESNAFRHTQGRKLDIPDGSTSVSIDLYIDPEWNAGGEQDGFRQAGFWATTFGPDGAISGYPIIEFATLNGEPGFRIWDGQDWLDFPWQGDIPFNEFVTLGIELGANGSLTYSVGDQNFTIEGLSTPGSTVGNVILQTYNQTYDDDGAVQTDEKRPEYSVYWDNLASEGGILDEDRDVSIFGDVLFEPNLFAIPEDVTLTARMDQLDSVGIVGTGTVKLTGNFDPEADLSGLIGTGITIDATGVEGFELTLTAAQADGLQLDVASDAQISIDVSFDELSADQPALEPQIDITGITVDGQRDVAAVFEVLSASGGFVDTMKLFWNAFDQAYYDALPGGGDIEVDTWFAELGNIYADYLAEGGDPILDIVQTKISGTPDFEGRQQSLHDNILANLKDNVINSRFGSDEGDDPRNDNAKAFGDRPEVNGILVDGEQGDAFLTGLIWDISNGYPREDAEDFLDAGTIYVVGSDGLVAEFGSIQQAVDSAGETDFIYVAGGDYGETVRVENDVVITMSVDAVLDGGFVVTDGNTLNLTGGTIENGATDTTKIIGSIAAGGGKAVYLQGSASVIAEGTTFRATEAYLADGAPQQIRAIEAEGSTAEGVIKLTNVNFEGPWLSALYVNPGEKIVTINGASFDDTGFDVADFASTSRWVVVLEQSGEVSIIDSTFISEFRSGGVSVSGDEGVTISGNDFSDMSGIAISSAQTATFGANRIGDRDFEQVIVAGSTGEGDDAQGDAVEGGDGDDIIFSGMLSNEIDISQGGADVIVLNADTVGLDDFTDMIIGFDAVEDGGDILQLVASEYALRGTELQLLEQGGSLGDNTGVAVYVTDFDLSTVFDEGADGDPGADLETEILGFLGDIPGDPDLDGMFIVVTDGTDSIVGRFEFEGGDVEIAGLAYLEGVDGETLTIENFDLSNVFGVQDLSGTSATT